MRNTKNIMLSVLCLIMIGITGCLNSCHGHPSSSDENKPENIHKESAPAYDKFVYRMEDKPISWLNFGMPLKVNLVTAQTTPVCTDPLCTHHDGNCPFYECSGCAIDGEILFYRRGWLTRDEKGYHGSEMLCSYHVATGKVHVLEEYNDSIVFLNVYDDMLYYLIAQWSDDNNELTCQYKLHRADGKSGKVTELSLPGDYRTVGGYTDNQDYPNILSIVKDTIYWYKYEEDMSVTFYTSNLTAENWTEISSGELSVANTYHDGWGYYIGADMDMLDPEAGFHSDNFISKYKISRRRLFDEKSETIATDTGSSNFIVTERYIFTLESLNPEHCGNAGAGMEVMNGCRVWRMNHDGSERTQIAEIDNYIFAYRTFTNDEILFDYYEDDENTYLAFMFMEYDENGKLTLSADTLILNTEAGEWTRSQYKP